jgi:hypothetical protein
MIFWYLLAILYKVDVILVPKFQGQDILAHHPPRNESMPPEKKQKNEDVEVKTEETDSEKEGEAVEVIGEAVEANGKVHNGVQLGEVEAPLPLRMNLRERSVESFRSLQNKAVDGLGKCSSHL